MATRQQCEVAIGKLASRLARRTVLSPGSGDVKTVSCTLSDLNCVMTVDASAGQTSEVQVTSPHDLAPKAGIRLSMSSDDLIALAEGRLNLASAWMGGRVHVGSGFKEMLRLRPLF